MISSFVYFFSFVFKVLLFFYFVEFCGLKFCCFIFSISAQGRLGYCSEAFDQAHSEQPVLFETSERFLVCHGYLVSAAVFSN